MEMPISQWKNVYRGDTKTKRKKKQVDYLRKLRGLKMIHKQYYVELEKQERLIERKNQKSDFYNGIYDRYQYPVLQTLTLWRGLVLMQ